MGHEPHPYSGRVCSPKPRALGRLMVAMELGHVRLLCRWKLMSPVGPNSQEVARPGGPSRWHTGHTREPLAPGPAHQPG